MKEVICYFKRDDISEDGSGWVYISDSEASPSLWLNPEQTKNLKLLIENGTAENNPVQPELKLKNTLTTEAIASLKNSDVSIDEIIKLREANII